MKIRLFQHLHARFHQRFRILSVNSQIQSLLILKIVNDRSQINSCFRSDRPHGHAIKSPEGKKLLCSTEDFAAGFRRTVGLGFAGRRHLLNNQTMRRLAGRTA